MPVYQTPAPTSSGKKASVNPVNNDKSTKVEPLTYAVQIGDSAFSIAAKKNLDVNSLLAANGWHLSEKKDGSLYVVENATEHEHVFHPGDTVLIPDGGSGSNAGRKNQPFGSGKNHFSTEQQYELALTLSEYEPEKVNGFNEFKETGYRYDPSKLYNQKVIYKRKFGVVPEHMIGAYKDYYFDPNTEAGRVMYSQLIKAKGADYKPSAQLLQRQVIEQNGDARVKQDVITALKKSQLVLNAINARLQTGKDNAETKNKLRKLGATLVEDILKICEILGKGDKDHPPAIKDQAFANKAGNIRTATQQGNIRKSEFPLLPLLVDSAIELIDVVSAALVEALLVTAATIALVATTEELVHEIENVDISELTDLLKEPLPKPEEKPKPIDSPPPFRDPDDDPCRPKPLGYHKGDTDDESLRRYVNTKRANEIADKEPPNTPDSIGRLGDWKVNNVAFDALARGKKELWEVKAHAYSSYSKAVKRQCLLSVKNTLDRELPVAKACGYDFVLALIDQKQKEDLFDKYPKFKAIRILIF